MTSESTSRVQNQHEKKQHKSRRRPWNTRSTVSLPENYPNVWNAAIENDDDTPALKLWNLESQQRKKVRQTLLATRKSTQHSIWFLLLFFSRSKKSPLVWCLVFLCEQKSSHCGQFNLDVSFEWQRSYVASNYHVDDWRHFQVIHQGWTCAI